MNANMPRFETRAHVTALKSLMRGASLFGIAGLLAGCHGAPFGTCEIRTLELTMPASWSFSGQTMTSDWFTQLVETNLEPALFHPMADAFADAGEGDGQLSWILPAFETNPGWIGLQIQLPLQAGDRIPIRGITPVGGFALRDARGEGAWAAVRIDDFIATDAEGEIEVVSVSPLSVRLDLIATDESDRTVTIEGVMAFRVFEQETSCF